MDYEIKKIMTKHGREKVMIYFSDDKYNLLTPFIACDVVSFGTSWIKKFIRGFDEVLSGEVEYKKGHLNLFAFEIGPVTTKVVNMFTLDEECRECEVKTKELRQIIEDWCDAVHEFRQAQENEALQEIQVNGEEKYLL